MKVDEARAILGVQEGTSDSEVVRSYRRMALMVRPDLGGSAEWFGVLNAAFDLLSDDSPTYVPRERANQTKANPDDFVVAASAMKFLNLDPDQFLQIEALAEQLRVDPEVGRSALDLLVCIDEVKTKEGFKSPEVWAEFGATYFQMLKLAGLTGSKSFRFSLFLEALTAIAPDAVQVESPEAPVVEQVETPVVEPEVVARPSTMRFAAAKSEKRKGEPPSPRVRAKSEDDRLLGKLGAFVYRWRLPVLILGIVLLCVCATFGSSVAEHLSSSGFDDPGSQASRAANALHREFGAVEPNVILVFEPQNGRTAAITQVDGTVVDDIEFQIAAQKVIRDLARSNKFKQTFNYWTLTGDIERGSFRNCNQSGVCSVLAFVSIDDTADNVNELVKKTLKDNETPLFKVKFAGRAALEPEFTTTIKKDLAQAELLALPLTLLLLLYIFRSVIAAFLPLAVGGFTIVATLMILEMISKFTIVSEFALNLTTMLGLGLAIDYSLFIVSRFREELAAGNSVEDAIVTTTTSAGRTVMFSGVAVGVSLVALVVFPQPFLKSFAFAGIAVAAVAMLGALVFLPAALSMLGPKIDRFSIRRHKVSEIGRGGWAVLARFVMKFAFPLAILVTALLVSLALPVRDAHFGVGDQFALPTSSPARSAMAKFAGFQAGNQRAVDVVFTDVPNARSHMPEVLEYKDRLLALRKTTKNKDGQVVEEQPVVAVVTPTRTFSILGDGVEGDPNAITDRAIHLQVVGLGDSLSYDAENFVRMIRAVPSPFENTLIGGASANLVDNKAAITNRMIFAILLIASVTFVVLMLMFGSILVPIKALALNTLSLCAVFGTLVWIFQAGSVEKSHGLLAQVHHAIVGFLGFTPMNAIEYSIPIVMFCVAFGLSMDYEVFMLSRIREEYERTGDNEEAVANGLQRSGRIITAAALLLSVVFVAFSMSGVSFIKMFGVGLILAVLVDATLVRAILVPSFMKLAGKANWWAPPRVKDWATRFGWRD